MRGFQWLGDSYAGGNELKTVWGGRTLDVVDGVDLVVVSIFFFNICKPKMGR